MTNENVYVDIDDVLQACQYFFNKLRIQLFIYYTHLNVFEMLFTYITQTLV